MTLNTKIMWFSFNFIGCAVNLGLVAYNSGSHFNTFVAGICATAALLYALDIWGEVA